MRIIKNINNNFALAQDCKGKMLIVSGKGIGFGVVPREIKDIKVIQRSFYNVDEVYISMINDLPEEMIWISNKIVEQANLTLDKPISNNIIFTLADHIKFSINRHQKHMNMKLPITCDIEQLFEKEVSLGEYGLQLIKERLHIHLPKEEAAYIALHILNFEEQEKTKQGLNEEVIEDITSIIEKEYERNIDRKNFNYSRFISHMHYLIKRSKTNHLIFSQNESIYIKLKDSYPKTNDCVEKVNIYLTGKLHIELTNEEKLYLMLHINRLCTREDCDQ